MKAPMGSVSVSIPDRTIKIKGRISLDTVYAVARGIRDMQRRNLDPIVIVIVNSRGGCASSGQMIFGILQKAISPIYTVAEQFAWSSAFYIFLGGEQRIMFKNARVGPHSTTITFYRDVDRDINQQYGDMVYTSKFNEKLFTAIRSVIKIPPKKAVEMCLDKKVFSAREAHKIGIATHIASGKKFYRARITKKPHKARMKVQKIGPK